MERAFYKTYYIYGSENGYKEIKDVLRASLIFTSFTDLYKTFTIIENMVTILRVKDRFHPKDIPFGYRDCLINFYCPTTKIVVELQLHAKQFYDLKKISHKMYKRARLFNLKKNDENLAYEYATKYIRPLIGDKAFYEMNKKDVEEASIKDKTDNGDDFKKEEKRPIEDGYYFIYAQHSDKALDIEGGSNNPGAKLIQWNIHGGDNQKFYFKYHKEHKKYTIQCKKSGLYLDVAGGSNADCAELLQWDFHGGNNQMFEVINLNDNIYRINTHATNKVFDICGGSVLNSAKVIQYKWTGHQNQRFRLKNVLNQLMMVIILFMLYIQEKY